MDASDITSVCLETMTAQLTTGERIPVTNMLDVNGDETSNPSLCAKAVAGPCSEGRWYGFAVEPVRDIQSVCGTCMGTGLVGRFDQQEQAFVDNLCPDCRKETPDDQ